MITEEFSLNVGVNPGYAHNNTVTHVKNLVATTWQAEAEKVFKKTGVFVAGVVDARTTVYKEEWGCPKGGEDTVVVTGLRNPEFQKDAETWMESVKEVCKAVATALEQTTAYLTFTDVDFYYLKPEPKA